jgi:hypothetical protein
MNAAGGIIILFAAICLIGFAYAGVIYACVYWRTRSKFRANQQHQVADDFAHGDWPHVPSISVPADFHSTAINTEAQRHDVRR